MATKTSKSFLNNLELEDATQFLETCGEALQRLSQNSLLPLPRRRRLGVITKLRDSNTCSERGRTHTDERGKKYLSACTDRCLVADVVLCVGAEASAETMAIGSPDLRLPPHQRREQSSASAGPFRTSATRHRSVPVYSRVKTRVCNHLEKDSLCNFGIRDKSTFKEGACKRVALQGLRLRDKLFVIAEFAQKQREFQPLQSRRAGPEPRSTCGQNGGWVSYFLKRRSSSRLAANGVT